MKLQTTYVNLFFVPFANDVDALTPELWSQEGLAILEENMIAGQLVYRDFTDEIKKYGDVVNTRKPAEFTAKRKGVNDDVTLQDATATNIAVRLDQLVHTSFIIRDGEESWAFQDLVELYLESSMIANARFLDQIVLGQYPHFLANAYPAAGTLSKTTVVDAVLGVREKMNVNKAPVAGRNLVWTASSESAALANELFISAEKVGDDGTALREASLGKKLGFQNWMDQNMASFLDASVDIDAAGALSGDHSKGTTSITTDNANTPVANGWVKIGGGVYRVVSYAAGALVTTYGLLNDVADGETVTVYGTGAVNNASGYAVGYMKEIELDGFTNFPQVGQILTFGTSPTSPIYSIIQVDGTAVVLDRPLEAALADDDAANMGAAANYNFAFNRNAIALVTRPLAEVRKGAGALSSVVNNNGFSMRTTIAYDPMKQGHIVTLDMICGVKVLDTDLGALLLG